VDKGNEEKELKILETKRKERERKREAIKINLKRS
jgi:hypothetical protein